MTLLISRLVVFSNKYQNKINDNMISPKFEHKTKSKYRFIVKNIITNLQTQGLITLLLFLVFKHFLIISIITIVISTLL